jgi:hypothetical protein
VLHRLVQQRSEAEPDADIIDAAATCSGVRRMLTPNASSTSADPLQLDA